MKKKLLVLLAIVLALSLVLAACQNTDECKHNFVNGFCTECGAADPNYTPPVNYV